MKRITLLIVLALLGTANAFAGICPKSHYFDGKCLPPSEFPISIGMVFLFLVAASAIAGLGITNFQFSKSN